MKDIRKQREKQRHIDAIVKNLKKSYSIKKRKEIDSTK